MPLWYFYMIESLNLLCSREGLKLLNLFLYDPDLEVNLTEAESKTKLSRNTVKKYLLVYQKEGILKSNKKGGIIFYSIAWSNPVVKQLKIFRNVTSLYNIIKKYNNLNLEIYLFGSAARGENTKNSDIDLLIITSGAVNNITITDIVDTIKDKLDIEVNPVIRSPDEYASLYDKDRAFYEGLERDKIRLI